ncbi:MAG: glutamine--fructose-6-phosphate transaminase (isomerizing) [Chloroflexi bacterium]|nr:glutamine--fructose-6-phosphate transaminase (isomerizing) [Chloroflexota bacterium]
MCGIFGYLGYQDAAPLVLAGLERLAYRGYDSAGVAVIDRAGHLEVRKSAGKLANLTTLLEREPLSGSSGLGHTRWATHGAPTDANAHPHLDGTGEVVVVHNGIVENYIELKARLTAGGHEFSSATDTEVIPHLIQELLAQGHTLAEAVRLAAAELRGAHAIACMHAGSPDTLVALRIGNAGGVSVGFGSGEMFVASDLPALLPLTTSVAPLAPGEMAVVTPEGCEMLTLDGRRIDTARQTVTMNPVAAAKGGHRHFMLKEIMEQPESAMSCLRGRLAFTPPSAVLGELPFTSEELRSLSRVVFLGMGTTQYATRVGARMTELLARLPASAEDASEYRYREPVVDEATLAVGVSQSGETADTLEAMHLAADGGARTLAITNVAGSQADRGADATLLMHAGPEIGVASTKTFVNSMLVMYLLATHLGHARGALTDDAAAGHVDAAARLPALLGEALELNRGVYERLAAAYVKARRFLFLGRGLLDPIAREGALKLKEISYIHAEGMAAAEMKHGPIALIDGETPVVAIVLRDALYEKMLGNISEVKARGGVVIAIATAGDDTIAAQVDDVLWVPPCPPMLAPMLAAVPVQLFAYHTAVHLGNDVDQPRNLAKSVTVE